MVTFDGRVKQVKVSDEIQFVKNMQTALSNQTIPRQLFQQLAPPSKPVVYAQDRDMTYYTQGLRGSLKPYAGVFDSQWDTLSYSKTIGLVSLRLLCSYLALVGDPERACSQVYPAYVLDIIELHTRDGKQLLYPLVARLASYTRPVDGLHIDRDKFNVQLEYAMAPGRRLPVIESPTPSLTTSLDKISLSVGNTIVLTRTQQSDPRHWNAYSIGDKHHFSAHSGKKRIVLVNPQITPYIDLPDGIEFCVLIDNDCLLDNASRWLEQNGIRDYADEGGDSSVFFQRASSKPLSCGRHSIQLTREQPVTRARQNKKEMFERFLPALRQYCEDINAYSEAAGELIRQAQELAGEYQPHEYEKDFKVDMTSRGCFNCCCWKTWNGVLQIPGVYVSHELLEGKVKPEGITKKGKTLQVVSSSQDVQISIKYMSDLESIRENLYRRLKEIYDRVKPAAASHAVTMPETHAINLKHWSLSETSK